MEAVKFLKERERMCMTLNRTGYESCEGCELDDVDCMKYILAYPEKAVSMVEKWSNDNPLITNRTKLEEVFGKLCDIRKSVKCSAWNSNNCYIFRENLLPCMVCPWWDEPYEAPPMEGVE